MALLDALLLRERRALARARTHASDHHYDEALSELHAFDSDRVSATREALRAEAIDHFGASAVRAAERSEGPRARARLDRARRFVTASLRPRLHKVEWRLRVHQLERTRAEHLVELVRQGEAARHRLEGGEAPPDSWATLAQRQVLAAVAARWELAELTSDDVLYADAASLSRARPEVAASYPDGLAEAVPRLGLGFVRAVLLLALQRPDRAALPLAEADDAEPLVCFERARTAQLLGLPHVARTCLQGFVARAGGHHRIRRLHTGVFLAQLELAIGDASRALEVMKTVPVERLGGRPALMYGRLLLDAGNPEEAQVVLRQLVERQPELEGAEPLLAEAERRCRISL